MLSRRAFLASTASLAVTAGITGTQAAMGPNDKFDLLVKGGDVLDPSQSLRGRRDIGIRFGVIEAVEPEVIRRQRETRDRLAELLVASFAQCQRAAQRLRGLEVVAQLGERFAHSELRVRLLAVELAVTLTAEGGAAISRTLAVLFFAVSLWFVRRSFYGMRIGTLAR